ncbi:uncharacterized protein C8Q71DRAFT_535533 [Rhodofomes roseus]|uniref:DUF4604 domain-containing protein n=1 Tax=Rhodofomes roseus TaxID=34475 RepID=A0ABQ8KKC1_9APHY|nr:uncharacterized protein C8Q71DRAFT_535533 [Rhodofomes roseus]KAH9838546.1 hypothetical protein C8Q71DRAFT_535533 [Rhodofomes roseus]
MSKEPTRNQLSSRLAYSAQTPAFLLRMQARVNGTAEDEDDDEYEYDGSGRPPIPKRPAIPERPDDDPGSAEEDNGDEKPQVVVLREGKHLSEREVENEKRKAKGLSPLPDIVEGEAEAPASGSTSQKDSAEKQAHSRSFGSIGLKTKSTKRKAVGDARDDEPPTGKPTKGMKKKPKKAEKKLLSFGDES